MSRPGWYNENINRAYPFVHGTVGLPSGPPSLSRLPDAAVADCGFLLGVDSKAAPSAAAFLHSIKRVGSAFVLRFGTDAPAMAGSLLEFTRSIGDEDFTSEHIDSDHEPAGSLSDSGSFSSLPAETCGVPLWSGFLVTGRIAALAELLPGDGELTRTGPGEADVEPALVQSLAGGYVKSVALASADRTRVTAPEGCPDEVWPVDAGEIHVQARCFQGDILFMAGYNSVVRQDAAANAIIFGASVGAGAGEPCAELSLASDDAMATGPGCDEVLRSFNGVGGRLFRFAQGTGVAVGQVPGFNRVIIDASLAGLAACGAEASEGSVVSVSESA